MIWPVSRTGWPAAVARAMRSPMITVGEGMTMRKQFSIVRSLSKSRISCVPVPTSTASTRLRPLTAYPVKSNSLLIDGGLTQHRRHCWMLAIEPQVLAPRLVERQDQNAVVDTDAQQIA